MTVAEMKKKDPVLRSILQTMAARNVAAAECNACWKILTEGVDGRFANLEYSPVNLFSGDSDVFERDKP